MMGGGDTEVDETTTDVLLDPSHAYTKTLLAAIPVVPAPESGTQDSE